MADQRAPIKMTFVVILVALSFFVAGAFVGSAAENRRWCERLSSSSRR